MDLMVFSLHVAGLSSLVGSLNFIVTFMRYFLFSFFSLFGIDFFCISFLYFFVTPTVKLLNSCYYNVFNVSSSYDSLFKYETSRSKAERSEALTASAEGLNAIGVYSSFSSLSLSSVNASSVSTGTSAFNY
jgi:hypothetical protein